MEKVNVSFGDKVIINNMIEKLKKEGYTHQEAVIQIAEWLGKMPTK